MATSFIPKIVFGTGPTTIAFDFPNKKDPFGLELKHVGKTTVAKSGNTQTITDHILQNNSITFSHVSESIKISLENFFKTHAFLGKSFSYFEDKDDPTTERTVIIDPRAFRAKFKVLTRKGVGFLWEVKIKIREVVA